MCGSVLGRDKPDDSGLRDPDQGVSYIDCHICIEVGNEPRRALEGSLLCRRCGDVLWKHLSEIESMWHLLQDPYWLADTIEPKSDMGTKSRPPCNLDPIVVTDPRSRYTGRYDLVSAPRVLHAWGLAVADSIGFRAIPTETEDWITFLYVHRNWIMSQPAVTRFARHVAAVHHSLRKVTHYE